MVDPFVDDYLAGRTPSPCVRCNTWIKFDLLLERRAAAGRRPAWRPATTPASSHGAGRPRAAHRGRRREGPELLPLRADRRAARRLALPARRADQARGARARPRGGPRGGGEGGEHGGLLRGRRHPRVRRGRGRRQPERFARADRRRSPSRRCWSTPQGEELGAGQPYYRYTVGQRRGLGLAAPSPLYVLRIEPEREPGRRRRRGAELMAPGLLGRAAALDRPRVHCRGRRRRSRRR